MGNCQQGAHSQCRCCSLFTHSRALHPHRAVKFKAIRVAWGAEHKQKGALLKLKYLTFFYS